MIIRPVYLAGLSFLFCSLLTGFGGSSLLSSGNGPSTGYLSEQDEPDQSILSPIWGPDIQGQSAEIEALATAYGLHPDLIAAVLEHSPEEAIESASYGDFWGFSAWRPAGSGDWQNAPLSIFSASGENLRWKMDVLTFAIHESGGDLSTALAVYYGGWSHANDSIPREYATRVLDRFGRALLTRQGIFVQPSTKWTIAIKIQSGNMPPQSMLVMGPVPPAGIRPYADHIVYSSVDHHDRPMYFRGVVVPLSLVDLDNEWPEEMAADQLEIQLQARLGDKGAATSNGNFRLLIACLPTLDRLQGQTTTRWYAPTSCPPNMRE